MKEESRERKRKAKKRAGKEWNPEQEPFSPKKDKHEGGLTASGKRKGRPKGSKNKPKKRIGRFIDNQEG